MKQLRGQADAVSKYSVTLEANANKEGHLYGSIVANDISKALKSAGYAVEPDHIKLDGPLKELGMYTVQRRAARRGEDRSQSLGRSRGDQLADLGSLRFLGAARMRRASVRPTRFPESRRLIQRSGGRDGHWRRFHTKLPPQNLDAERSVLGSMLLSNDAVDEVASFLKATHFYLDAHQQI